MKETIPYTYLIGWTTHDKWYYGRRTSEGCNPKEFWKKYFTSSKYVKEFRKEYGEPDIIQIRKVFDSVEKCSLWEYKVLTKLNAARNDKWINLHNAGDKFDVTGKVTVKDKDGNFLSVLKDDPKYLSGELTHHTKGTITVKDKNGNFFKVSKDDPRYLSGELVGINKGKVTVKDKDGNFFKVSKDDPRYLSGELVGVTKGLKWTKKTEFEPNTFTLYDFI